MATLLPCLFFVGIILSESTLMEGVMILIIEIEICLWDRARKWFL